MGIPRVSIGLPVYNGRLFIRTAIESILGQTFQDFELIISDNASTDETVSIVSEYVEKDNRIRFFPQTCNQGLVKNFNLVFGLSTAEYFRWATADDYISPSYLEKCVNILDSNPDAVLCYANTTIVDSLGNRIRNQEENLDLSSSKPSERYKKYYSNVRLCNVQYGLMRSAVLRKTRLLQDFIGSDIVLLSELALHGKFVEIQEYLFYRRIHDNSSYGIRDSEMLLHQYYHPGKKSNVYMHEWQHLFGKMSTVYRVPLKASERVKIYETIIKSAFRNRKELAREIYNAISILIKAVGKR